MALMKVRSSLRNHTLVFGALMLAAIALPSTGVAAERVVFAEYFSRTTCSYCAYASHAIDRILNEDPDTFITLVYHVGDSYVTVFSAQRDAFYEGTSTPTTWFDGEDPAVGAYLDSSIMYSWYTEVIDNKRTVPTDVTIEIEGSIVDMPDCHADVTVCMERGGSPRDLRIMVSQALDDYPNTPANQRYAARQGSTLATIQLAPGECHTLPWDFTLESICLPRLLDVALIAWAQEDAAMSPAAVMQASKISWPFAENEPNGDYENNGVVNLDDHFFMAGCLSGPQPSTEPSDHCLRSFDFDDDGDIDLSDAGEFAAAFGEI